MDDDNSHRQYPFNNEGGSGKLYSSFAPLHSLPLPCTYVEKCNLRLDPIGLPSTLLLDYMDTNERLTLFSWYPLVCYDPSSSDSIR